MATIDTVLVHTPEDSTENPADDKQHVEIERMDNRLNVEHQTEAVAGPSVHRTKPELIQLKTIIKHR